MTTTSQPTGQPPIRAIVAMLRVADVERSVEFYRLLGFEVGNRAPPIGPPHWVWLYAPTAADWKLGPNLMLTRSETPIDPDAQQTLLYLYASDLTALRESLLAKGERPGEIDYPEYLPAGEFNITDPDGYCLMVAQVAADTP